MNLLEQQAANRRRTWLVMAAFITIFLLIGLGVDIFVIGDAQVYLPIATIVALVIAGGRAWWSVNHGDRAVLGSADAQPVEDRIRQAATEDDRLRYRQFQNVVEEMAIAAGVPTPRAYVIPDNDPNAFATGPDPAHASIAADGRADPQPQSRRASGRRRARDGAHPQSRHPPDDGRGRAGRSDRAAG